MIPTIRMIADQLRVYLNVDKIEAEQNSSIKKTEPFFIKWKAFIIFHFFNPEIADLLRLFCYTEWYIMECRRSTIDSFLG